MIQQVSTNENEKKCKVKPKEEKKKREIILMMNGIVLGKIYR